MEILFKYSVIGEMDLVYFLFFMNNQVGIEACSRQQNMELARMMNNITNFLTLTTLRLLTSSCLDPSKLA